jgi:hypothetical protein
VGWGTEQIEVGGDPPASSAGSMALVMPQLPKVDPTIDAVRVFNEHCVESICFTFLFNGLLHCC